MDTIPYLNPDRRILSRIRQNNAYPTDLSLQILFLVSIFYVSESVSQVFDSFLPSASVSYLGTYLNTEVPVPQ